MGVVLRAGHCYLGSVPCTYCLESVSPSSPFLISLLLLCSHSSLSVWHITTFTICCVHLRVARLRAVTAVTVSFISVSPVPQHSACHAVSVQNHRVDGWMQQAVLLGLGEAFLIKRTTQEIFVERSLITVWDEDGGNWWSNLGATVWGLGHRWGWGTLICLCIPNTQVLPCCHRAHQLLGPDWKDIPVIRSNSLSSTVNFS